MLDYFCRTDSKHPVGSPWHLSFFCHFEDLDKNVLDSNGFLVRGILCFGLAFSLYVLSLSSMVFPSFVCPSINFV